MRVEMAGMKRDAEHYSRQVSCSCLYCVHLLIDMHRPTTLSVILVSTQGKHASLSISVSAPIEFFS